MCVCVCYTVYEAEQIFNRYRRDGHHFSVSLYNKMLHCWVKKASIHTCRSTYVYVTVCVCVMCVCVCVCVCV